MVKKALLLVSFVGANALACAQHVTLIHHYTVGQTLVYSEKTSGSFTYKGKTSDMSSVSTMTTEVTKVYPNGDADISVVFRSQNQAPGVKPAPHSNRVNKWGVPVNSPEGAASFSFFGFEKGIDVGQTVPYNVKGKGSSFELKGTVTLLKVSGGIATFHMVTTSEPVPNAGVMRSDATYEVDISTANVIQSKSVTTGAGMSVTSSMALQSK